MKFSGISYVRALHVNVSSSAHAETRMRVSRPVGRFRQGNTFLRVKASEARPSVRDPSHAVRQRCSLQSRAVLHSSVLLHGVVLE